MVNKTIQGLMLALFLSIGMNIQSSEIAYVPTISNTSKKGLLNCIISSALAATIGATTGALNGLINKSYIVEIVRETRKNRVEIEEYIPAHSEYFPASLFNVWFTCFVEPIVRKHAIEHLHENMAENELTNEKTEEHLKYIAWYSSWVAYFIVLIR